MKTNEISIGRSSINDIIIENKVVSSFHAKLVILDDGSLWIHDLDSTNGVFLNGNRISGKCRVTPNDKIQLGTFEFNWQQAILVSSSSDTQPPAAAPNESQAKRLKKRKKKTLWIGAAATLSIALVILLIFNTNMVEKSKEVMADLTGSWKTKNDPIQYDISCLTKDSEGGSWIKTIGDAKKEVLGAEDVEITTAEEEEVGLEVKKQIESEFNYSKDPAYTKRIEAIATKLMASLSNPRFNYQFHVLESDIVNAFTVGGQVFVNTGIIDFAQSDDELACILGHEIYHNELGHIQERLKELKIARNWLGEGLGDLAYYVSSLLSTSFNQENEVYSDLYGLDLAVKAGFNGCAGITFWERMQESEGAQSKTLFDKFSRSHPYSDERVKCNRSHIDHNYYHSCP